MLFDINTCIVSVGNCVEYFRVLHEYLDRS
jgi:hypothetical protein